MPILEGTIYQEPSPFISPIDNIYDLGNDERGFKSFYGQNSGETPLYGDLAVYGILNTAKLSTPGTPTIATVGTAGATNYGYKIVATVTGGDASTLYTAASAEGTIATGNAALSANNYNRVTWASVPGATGYRVYRTTGGATQGLIATITNGTTLTLNDTGLAGGGETAPTANVTGEINQAGQGSLRSGSNGTDVYLDKITTGGVLGLWNRTDAKGLLLDFTNNLLEVSGLNLTIRANKADASTILFQAQNAAGQTQTVAQITGNATVADSTFDAAKLRLTGSLTLNANGTLNLGDATNKFNQLFARGWTGGNGQTVDSYQEAAFRFSQGIKIGGTAGRSVTDATFQLELFNGTAPSGTLANGFTLYSSGGLAYIMNAAGTTGKVLIGNGINFGPAAVASITVVDGQITAIS